MGVVGGGTVEDRYDVVVVGAGLGGLTAAAFLARSGISVLCVDAQDGPGGCARPFRRGPYTFDPAVHVTVEAEPGGMWDLFLEHIGVLDKVVFERLEHAWVVDMPDRRVGMPVGHDAINALITELFPHAAAGAGEFLEEQRRFFWESAQLGMQLGLRNLDEAVRQLPTFFRHRNLTVAQVLEPLVDDPAARALLTAGWLYNGLPPSRLSFLTFAMMTNTMLEIGCFAARGGFGTLVDAIAQGFAAHGGHLLTGAPVQKILVEGGQVRGVELPDGARVAADAVISGADATATIERLVGADSFPQPFLRRLRRLHPSVSAVVLFAATDMDLGDFGGVQETILLTTEDPDRAFADVQAGRPGAVWVSVPSSDGTQAPAGEQTFTVSSLAAYDPGRDWDEILPGYQEALLDLVEARCFPGVRSRLTHVETAGPTAIERWTGNRDGAAYGWAPSPQQSGSKRLPHVTPLPGLYLSGHWTFQGLGSFRVMVSGMETARAVQQALGRGEPVPTLRPTRMPPKFEG
jgi:phytoene desaturase